MILINLFGAPSAGKTVIAANTFTSLKRRNVHAELVGEFAKELIYLGNETQLANQVYILGSQYRKQKDLQRYNVNVAISDSPLLLQLVYCQNKPYYPEMCALVKKLNSEFNNINVFVKRVKPYQVHGRVHSEAESDIIAANIWDSMNGDFHFVIDGDDKGAEYLAEEVLKLADKDLISQF